jgi:hypothetical protein
MYCEAVSIVVGYSVSIVVSNNVFVDLEVIVVVSRAVSVANVVLYTVVRDVS